MLVIIVTIRKNMNIFTIYVNQHNQSPDWNWLELGKLFPGNQSILYIFKSCLKLLKKAILWLYLDSFPSVILEVFVFVFVFSLSVKLFYWMGVILSEKGPPAMFICAGGTTPQNACLLVCGHGHKDKNALKSV